MIGSNSDRSAFKARSSEPHKTKSVYVHQEDLRSFAQLAISVPDRCKGLTSDRTHDQRTNAYKSVRSSWLMSLTIILFTCVAPHTKSKMAPYRCSTHLLLLSACSTHLLLQKARGSIGMCSKFIILLIKFSKVFTAQQVSSWVHLLVFIGTWRNKWARDWHLLWSGISARSTHKLHPLITNQLILHHDERISKRISTTYDQYTDPRFFYPVHLKYW
jgi:hypothetical protein